MNAFPPLPRICIASSGLGHVARGIEAWADDLGRALVARGAETIVCKGAGKADAAHERVVPTWTRESQRARRLAVRMPRFLGWRLGLDSGYSIEQTTFAWNLIGLLRREAIDILHVQDPLVALYVQHARRLGLVRARTILAHGTEETFEFQRRITYLQHLAPWHLDEARAAGVWKPTWTAIPNFIDTDHFRPRDRRAKGSTIRQELGIPSEAIVLLTAAAIKRNHKRIDYLLREAARLVAMRSDLPIFVIVAGGWEAETDALVAEGESLLGDRVRFLVRFPRGRMADLYRAADLFVLASLKEMMPIALLEATASGLPCVVHEQPVMQWMIGGGGRAADLTQPGRLADVLADLAADHDLRWQQGLAAREHCVSNFSRDRVVDQILEYYARVLDRQPSFTPAAAIAAS